MQRDDGSSSKSGVVGADELTLTVCPSFSTYYSDRQAAAARAVNDVLAAATGSSSSSEPRSELDEVEFGFATTGRLRRSDGDVVEEDEFEFSILSIPDGEIGQIYPIFDRDLVGVAAKVDAASVSLKKLFLEEERDEDDGRESEELESVEPGTYCVWKPKTSSSSSSSSSQTPPLSPSTKSKSTGSCSRRWKLRDLLLRRSNSDGKESFVFLTPSPITLDEAKGKARRRASAHEMFYVEKRAVKEEDRKRSYLPYRKALVGFGFGMGVTNNFRPF